MAVPFLGNHALKAQFMPEGQFMVEGQFMRRMAQFIHIPHGRAQRPAPTKRFAIKTKKDHPGWDGLFLSYQVSLAA